MSLTLHYFPLSSCSRKVLFSLYYKELDFEARFINLAAKEQHTPSFLALNPHGKVPVLQVGDKTLYDSCVIMEYLEEYTSHKPLLFGSALERALIRKLTQYADQFFYPVISSLLAELRAERASGTCSRAFEPQLDAFQRDQLSVLDAQLSGASGPFLFDRLSLADIAFAMGLVSLQNNLPQPLIVSTQIRKWLDTFLQEKAFQQIEVGHATT